MRPIIVGKEGDKWLRTWFADIVVEHLGRTGEHSRDFSRKAARNTRFWEQFQAGSSPRLDTMEAVLQHIHDMKTADQLDMLS